MTQELSYDYFSKRNSKQYIQRPKGSPRSVYCDVDHLHDSMDEADECNALHKRVATGELTEVHSQHRLDIKINGVWVTNHKVDFYIVYADGKQEFVEVKGGEDAHWAMLRRLIIAVYPHIRYTVKKAKPNFFMKNKMNGLAKKYILKKT